MTQRHEPSSRDELTRLSRLGRMTRLAPPTAASRGRLDTGRREADLKATGHGAPPQVPVVGSFAEECLTLVAGLRRRLEDQPVGRPLETDFARELQRSLHTVTIGASCLGHPRLELAGYDARQVVRHLRGQRSVLSIASVRVLVDLLGAVQEAADIVRCNGGVEPPMDSHTALRRRPCRTC